MLSTYNGERYLSEQLDSLLSQVGVELTILIRDDGSSDSTLEIIEEYSLNFSSIITLREENIGCARSFFSLMSRASREYREFDYYAFCDQDDKWLPTKLKVATKALQPHLEANPYRLYYSSASYVNQHLEPLRQSWVDSSRVNFATSLTRNPALGCTMLFSGELLRQASKIESYVDSEEFNATLLPLHDAWLFRVAHALGSYIHYDAEPHILYRQHDNNVTGSKSKFERYHKGLKRRIAKRGQFSHIAKLLKRFYSDALSQSDRATLEQLLTYKESIYNTLRFSVRLDLHGELLLDQIIWRLYILNRFY